MRDMKLLPCLLALLGGVIVATELGHGQGGDTKKPSLINPGQIFDSFMSKGRGYFLVTEVVRDRETLQKFVEREGITDGKVTRDQFIKFWGLRDELKKAVAAAKPAPKDPVDARAESAFRQFDEDNDGLLSLEEIARVKGFKKDWQTWDADGDGKINLAEWTAYWRTVDPTVADAGANVPEKTPTKPDAKPVAVKPVVGPKGVKYPPGLPAWFAELDLEREGRVSLYAWRTAGKDLDVFNQIDLNDDGFLSTVEVLRFQGAPAPKPPLKPLPKPMDKAKKKAG